MSSHRAVPTQPRAVVVGAGPSGFYAADQLLAAGFAVDLLDRLPTPFGLVRAGVAPDHPKIKTVTRVYEKTAARLGFRFFGGIELGVHVSRSDLLARYHVVIYAYGTAEDRRLGIPGEDRPGCYGASDFVAWYNGHPDAAGLRFGLDARRVVVVGNGNVAIDVARMLLADPLDLGRTDMADHAVAALATSAVREVVLLGRRGPAQAAFTTPELRELGDIDGVDVVVDAAQLSAPAQGVATDASESARRNLELLETYAARPVPSSHRVISFRFARSPVEILGDGGDGRVTAIRLAHTRLEPAAGGAVRAVPTGAEEVLGCGAVFRSIGYRGRPCAGVPFDPARGVVLNDRGRVVTDRGHTLIGEYAVGWIKRGASGVIGTNKKDAAETTGRVSEDLRAGRLNQPGEHDPDRIAGWLLSRAPETTTWSGWQAIDDTELDLGARQGRPRVKLVNRPELYAAAGSALM